MSAGLAGCGSGGAGNAVGANASAVDIARAAHAAEARVEAYRRGRTRIVTAATPAARTAPALVASPTPSLPAIATATYACADGSRFAARFDNRTADLTLRGDEEAVTLRQQPAASGIHYAGEGWDLRGKGRDATITRPGAEPLVCGSIEEASTTFTAAEDAKRALSTAPR